MSGRIARLAVLLACLTGAAAVGTAATGTTARAEPLVADLSSHLIAITTGFTGTSVLLFGAIEDEGDVVVVVRGPETPVEVQRKGRLGGVWVNRESMTFGDAPIFYAVASSTPLDRFASESVRARHQIGVEFLRLTPTNPAPPSKAETFREALIRNKQADGLYVRAPEKVTFLGPRLFRTTLYFPSNVPTGTYWVEVLMIRNQQVVNAEITPLVISKIGVGAEIFDFAHRHSVYYGLIAVAAAAAAGWVAGLVFRKA